MGKYTDLETDIFSIFASTSWESENIDTYPGNFISTGNSKEFIRVNIIPSGKGVNRVSISGVVIIDIFTFAGEGTRKASLIADTLDKYLGDKAIALQSGKTTQFGSSSMTLSGSDSDNPSLFRASYTIPFNFFGVL